MGTGPFVGHPGPDDEREFAQVIHDGLTGALKGDLVLRPYEGPPVPMLPPDSPGARFDAPQVWAFVDALTGNVVATESGDQVYAQAQLDILRAKVADAA